MTWLSRLLPQSPRLPRLADHNLRTRQAQRRRRMSTLEALEGRTLLSNVSATVVANTLVIVGDQHNDSFKVTENPATGLVTVVGTPAPSSNPHLPPSNTTQINNLPVGLAFTTSQSVQVLDIFLPGNFNNTDYVTLTEGPTTGTGTLRSVTIVAPGGVGAGVEGLDLNLTVTNLSVSGPFALYDAPTYGPASSTLPAIPALPTGQAPNAPPTSLYTPPTNSAGNPLNQLGGVLNATITGSHFSSLYLEQDGCCLADVTLNSDTVTGSVTVEEGVANGDQVYAADDTFQGATTITQYYGPTMSGCYGTGDLVYVNQTPSVAGTSNIFDLAIYQNGPGTGQIIDVGTSYEVEVAITGFGVIAEQPNAGGSDLIYIESITVYGHLTNSFLPYGPPSIYTLQGNGGNDTTNIDSSTVWGNISAYQGNSNDGSADHIILDADSAGYTTPGAGGLLIPSFGLVTLSQGNGNGDTVFLSSTGTEFDALNVFNNLSITQRNGNSDIVTVDSTVVVTGNIIVVQGYGAYDVVNVTSSTAGYTTQSGPILTDHGGLLAIIQGNGYSDSVTITSFGLEGDFGSIFNNVFIYQGNSLNGLPVDCLEPTGDLVTIDQTTINSNLIIFQNAVFSLAPAVSTGDMTSVQSIVADPAIIVTDGAGLGNNVVLIGTGAASGGVGTGVGQVYVGEETLIYQGGKDNTVWLGGASGDNSGVVDFETGFLDIWTGAGGGGTVQATNTTVDFGSFFGNSFVINGGGTGNTYVDLLGNNPDPLPYGPNYRG